MNMLNTICFKRVTEWTQLISNISTAIGVIGAILTIFIGIKLYKKQKQIDALTTYYSNIKRHLKIFIKSFELNANNFTVLYYFSKLNEDIRNVREYDRISFEKLRTATINALMNASTFATFKQYEKDCISDEENYDKELVMFNECFAKVTLECCVNILLRELLYLEGIATIKIDERPKLFDDSTIVIKYTKNLQALSNEIICRIDKYAAKVKLL